MKCINCLTNEVSLSQRLFYSEKLCATCKEKLKAFESFNCPICKKTSSVDNLSMGLFACKGCGVVFHKFHTQDVVFKTELLKS